MDVTRELLQAVLLHAQDERPKECCGLVVLQGGEQRYARCRNIAEKDNDFVLDPDDFAAAEDAGEVVGVAHSHVLASPEPSMADLVGVEGTNLPWLIVNWPNGTYRVVEPSGWQAPLEGRQYAWGVLDCYTLVQDYYARVLDIPVALNSDRDWLRAERLNYEEHLNRFGFGAVAEPEKHDILVMRPKRGQPPHFGVYVGEGKMLHHYVNRYSSIDYYGTFWRERTVVIARHRSRMGEKHADADNQAVR